MDRLIYWRSDLYLRDEAWRGYIKLILYIVRSKKPVIEGHKSEIKIFHRSLYFVDKKLV